MTSSRAVSLFVLATLCAAASIAACGGASGDSSDPGGDATIDGGGDESGFDLDVGDKKVAKIDVSPSGKTIEVVNGDTSKATISFTAKATFDDGSTIDLPSCVWSTDRIDLGSFTGATFTASGGAGGTGKATCTALGMSGSATFTVFLRDEIDNGERKTSSRRPRPIRRSRACSIPTTRPCSPVASPRPS
jgi:hypothetical protein